MTSVIERTELDEEFLTSLKYKPGTKIVVKDCAEPDEVGVTVALRVRDVDAKWWWALTRPIKRNYRETHIHIPRSSTRAEAAKMLHGLFKGVEAHETDEYFRYPDGTPVVTPNHDLEVTASCPTGRYPAYTGKCW